MGEALDLGHVEVEVRGGCLWIIYSVTSEIGRAGQALFDRLGLYFDSSARNSAACHRAESIVHSFGARHLSNRAIAGWYQRGGYPRV